MKSSKPFWTLTTEAAAFAVREYFWPFRALATFVASFFRQKRKQTMPSEAKGRSALG
jgi:hypothetical protein